MKRFLMATLTAVVVVLFSGGASFASSIYLNSADGQIFSYNLQSGTTTDVLKSVVPLSDSAYMNGQFYGLGPIDLTYLSYYTPSHLQPGNYMYFKISPDGEVGYLLGYGSARSGLSTDGLTSNGEETLYMGASSGFLYMDERKGSGSHTGYAGDAGVPNITELAYHDGLFFVASSPTPGGTSHLSLYDKNTLACNSLGDIGYNLSSLGFVDGKLLGFTSGGKLIDINLNTGAGTLIGDIGRQVSGFAGVAPTPIPGAIWILGAGLTGLAGLKRKFSKA